MSTKGSGSPRVAPAFTSTISGMAFPAFPPSPIAVRTTRRPLCQFWLWSCSSRRPAQLVCRGAG